MNDKEINKYIKDNKADFETMPSKWMDAGFFSGAKWMQETLKKEMEELKDKLKMSDKHVKDLKMLKGEWKNSATNNSRLFQESQKQVKELKDDLKYTDGIAEMLENKKLRTKVKKLEGTNLWQKDQLIGHKEEVEEGVKIANAQTSLAKEKDQMYWKENDKVISLEKKIKRLKEEHEYALNHIMKH